MSKYLHWAPGAAARLSFSSGLASVLIGLLFGAVQLQGWKMPAWLAVTLLVVLGVMLVAALSVPVYETVRALRRAYEYRITTPSWVSSEMPGLFDYEADALRANEHFAKTLIRLSNDTERLGKKTKRQTRYVEKAATKSAKGRQKRSDRYAANINKSAAFNEKRLALLRALVMEIFRDYHGAINIQPVETEEERQGLLAFRAALDENRESTSGSYESTAGYLESIRNNEALNISRSMRIAYRRLGNALEGVVRVLRQYERGSVLLERAIDKKLGA